MYEEVSQVANDAVGSIRAVASFCEEPKVMDMYRKKCLGPEKQGVWVGPVSGAGFGFSFFSSILHICFLFLHRICSCATWESNIFRCFKGTISQLPLVASPLVDVSFDLVLTRYFLHAGFLLFNNHSNWCFPD